MCVSVCVCVRVCVRACGCVSVIGGEQGEGVMESGRTMCKEEVQCDGREREREGERERGRDIVA